MKNYKWVFSKDTLELVESYKQKIIEGTKTSQIPRLDLRAIAKVSSIEILNLLTKSRKSVLMAEKNKESIWNEEEMEILGKMSFRCQDITFYDEGQRTPKDIQCFEESFKGDVYFTSGPLLEKELHITDRERVVENDSIDIIKYQAEIKSRLLPVLLDINNNSHGQKAIIGLAGLGCGYFAGEFKDMDELFGNTVKNILNENKVHLQNISTIQLAHSNISFDLNNEFAIQQQNTNVYQPLAIRPEKKQKFFRIVAWDPFSYPGNEFWGGPDRSSDDPIIMLSTNIVDKICYNEDKDNGKYDKQTHTFQTKIDKQEIARTHPLNVNQENCIIVDPSPKQEAPPLNVNQDDPSPKQEAPHKTKWLLFAFIGITTIICGILALPAIGIIGGGGLVAISGISLGIIVSAASAVGCYKTKSVNKSNINKKPYNPNPQQRNKQMSDQRLYQDKLIAGRERGSSDEGFKRE